MHSHVLFMFHLTYFYWHPLLVCTALSVICGQRCRFCSVLGITDSVCHCICDCGFCIDDLRREWNFRSIWAWSQINVSRFRRHQIIEYYGFTSKINRMRNECIDESVVSCGHDEDWIKERKRRLKNMVEYQLLHHIILHHVALYSISNSRKDQILLYRYRQRPPLIWYGSWCDWQNGEKCVSENARARKKNQIWINYNSVDWTHLNHGVNDGIVIEARRSRTNWLTGQLRIISAHHTIRINFHNRSKLNGFCSS